MRNRNEERRTYEMKNKILSFALPLLLRLFGIK